MSFVCLMQQKICTDQGFATDNGQLKEGRAASQADRFRKDNQAFGDVGESSEFRFLLSVCQGRGVDWT